MIAFKHEYMVFHWHLLHPQTLALVSWVASHWWQWTGDHFTVVTSVWRPGPGIHRHYRAVDIRLRQNGVGGAPHYDQDITDQIEREINHWWDYGKEPYQCALVHGDGAQFHLHLQARAETKERTFA